MAVAHQKELPRFVEPMLATPGQPFDSDEYLFEIKWDGVRALAFIEEGRYRLLNRRQAVMIDRYPEFAVFASLPAGSVLDGEVVVLRHGKPDFNLLQSRDHSRSAFRVRTLAQSTPATFIAFDLLYESYESLMARPLVERRERLRLLLVAAASARLVLSEGVVGKGLSFFQEALRLDLEGMVAKRLQSQYLPGKRSDAWIKIKRNETYFCAVIGFVPKPGKDFRNLILAEDRDGQLHYAGKVGTGFDTALRARINGLLWSRLRPKPLVSCPIKGNWVDPGIYCQVSCMERTERGEFRMPVFEELRVE